MPPLFCCYGEGMVTGLLITADGKAERRTLEGRLEALRAAIGGGWLVAVNGANWHAYADEDGIAKGQPVNPSATALAEELGFMFLPGDALRGTVLFLGHTAGGHEASAPGRVWDAAERLGLTVAPA